MFAERCEGEYGIENVERFAMMRIEDYTTIASRAAVYTAAIFALQNACWEIPNPFKSAPSRRRLRDGIAE